MTQQTDLADPKTATTSGTGCPSCGHTEPLERVGLFSKKLTCAHVDIEQGALVDDAVRCDCLSNWHRR